MSISLNVRCFREISGLVVRDAACFWKVPGAAEAQDLQKPNFSVWLKLSASSTLAPVNHLKSNQRNRAFSLHQNNVRDQASIRWVRAHKYKHKHARRSYSIYRNHLSLPKGCQSCWFVLAPPPLRLFLEDRAGRRQSKTKWHVSSRIWMRYI